MTNMANGSKHTSRTFDRGAGTPFNIGSMTESRALRPTFWRPGTGAPARVTRGAGVGNPAVGMASPVWGDGPRTPGGT